MNTTFFNHNHIRQYNLAFLKLFTNIYISRKDPYGTEIVSKRVPLTYATKSKPFISKKQEFGVANKQISVLLPRIAVIMSGFDILHDEKLNALHKLTKYTSEDEKKALLTHTPTPIMINYSVSIWTKYHSDAHQILEQIIPYFHNDHMVNINIVSPMNINLSFPIRLESSSLDLDDNLDSEAESTRIITWNLEFSMKGLLFKPVIDSNIIRKATVNVNNIDENGNADPYSPYFQLIEEMYPDAYDYNDEWMIKETQIEGENNVIRFYDKESI